jgi:hypothetical protein
MLLFVVEADSHHRSRYTNSVSLSNTLHSLYCQASDLAEGERFMNRIRNRIHTLEGELEYAIIRPNPYYIILLTDEIFFLKEILRSLENLFLNEDDPGQSYFHRTNPNIRRAEKHWYELAEWRALDDARDNRTV